MKNFEQQSSVQLRQFRTRMSRLRYTIFPLVLALPAISFALPPVPDCEQRKGVGSACTEWQETVRQMNRISESVSRGERPAKPFNKNKAMQSCIKYYLSKGQSSDQAKATCKEVAFEP